MPPTALLDAVKERLPVPAGNALGRLLNLARKRSLSVYLVGGSVRDLLLGRPNLDLDLALEGDAISLARELAAATGGRLTSHRRFGTATVRAEGFALDLAMTRTETYARPGALPSVRPADLRQDLARRDFTVNATALGLSGPDEGSVVDPCGGQGDLERGLIRVLHQASFQDDATRILRALRYAGRLGFRLEPRTRDLLRRDLSFLDTISGARLRRELILILREERAPDIFSACGAAGVLGAAHPSLGLDRLVTAALRSLAEGPALASREEAMFCLLASGADEDGLRELIRRLGLEGRVKAALFDSLRLRAQAPALDEADLPPSQLTALLERYRPSAVWALALTAEGQARERVLRFLRQWRSLRPRLDGRALRTLGVPEGPAMGAILARLREARLDGRAATRDDELALARSLAIEARNQPAAATAGRDG
ncbi:MAG: hypothetical protein WBF37_01910 [Dehalococcoidia bacterium]